MKSSLKNIPEKKYFGAGIIVKSIQSETKEGQTKFSKDSTSYGESMGDGDGGHICLEVQ